MTTLTILKMFIDGAGRRMKPGMDVPSDYDKPTRDHYQRKGLIGEVQKPDPSPRRRRAPGPTETKPAAPAETATLQPIALTEAPHTDQASAPQDSAVQAAADPLDAVADATGAASTD